MYGGKSSEKNVWVFLVFLLTGVVLGGFIGQYAGSLPYMGWLAYNQSFGLDAPLKLDLGVITLHFALMLRISMSGIIGMILAIVAYRRL